MFIANDMALLAFLPLGYYVLTQSGNQKYMAFTFIMQNIAANLGGMLTPFGNPQNYFYIQNLRFQPWNLWALCFHHLFYQLLLLQYPGIFFTKNEPINLIQNYKMNLITPRSSIYLILFTISILIVFRSIPYLIGLIVIVISLLFLGQKVPANG